ncbi:MAG: Regulator of RpoS [Holosporales bacterium]
MVSHQKHPLYDSNILIVEDETINLKIMQIHLEKAGYKNLRTARNGLQALEMIALEKPDLVLLDLFMPVMNGFDALEQIRKNNSYEQLPVIVQTALDDIEGEQKVWEIGANDLVHKPIKKGEFLSRIYVQLHQHWLFKELTLYKKSAKEDIENSLSLQLSLLPQKRAIEKIEQQHGVKIGSIFKPCRFLSGDLWGIIPISDEKFALWISDFSGKGIKAALNTFRLHTILNQDGFFEKSPRDALYYCNNILKDLLPVGTFSTCLYMVCEPRSNKITYASASSPSPILYDRLEKKYKILPSDGYPLGIKKDADYQEHTLTLNPNQSFIVYSDAMWESVPDLGFSFEDDQLDSFIAELDGKEIVPSVNMILDSVGDEDLSLPDDLTIIELSFEKGMG